MPSPVNRPIPAFATGATIVVATETVLVTSPELIIDTPQYVVVLHGLVDLSVGTDATAVTLYLERGAVEGGTLISYGNTWGPYAVTGGDEYQFVVAGYDNPYQGFGAQYVLTTVLTANDSTTTVNAAYLEAIVQART